MHAPRDQHARPAANLQVAKELGAQDVLQRLPGRPVLDQLPQHRALCEPVTASRPRSGDLFDMLAQPSQLALCCVQVATGRQKRRQQRIYRMRLAEERVWDPGHFDCTGRMLVLSADFPSVHRVSTTTTRPCKPWKTPYIITCSEQADAQPRMQHIFALSILSDIM
jgi:hypothetical protein